MLKVWTVEELRKLAKDIYTGDVLMDRQIPENLQGSVFMPLLFLNEEQRAELKKADVGLVYGHMRDALHSSINGFPIFGACGFLSKADAKVMLEILGRLKILEVY